MRHVSDRERRARLAAIVGCWVQDDAGAVEVRLLEQVPAAATKALAVEAERLTEWLAGVRVSTVYPSTAMRAPAPWVVPGASA